MKRYQNWLNLLHVALATTCFLAACGKSNTGDEPLVVPSPNNNDEVVTVTFACERWRQEIYERLAKIFEADNPDVKVHILSFKDALGYGFSDHVRPDPDNMPQLTRAVDALEYYSADPFFARGYVRDLAPFIDQDSTFQAQDFYSGALESLQEEGSVLGLPSRIKLKLIFYDKDIFDQADVPYPEFGWTWDDFLTTAQALTNREGDRVTHWGMVEPFGLFGALSYIQGRAGPLMDDTKISPAPLLDEPQVVQAVSWYIDLYLKHQVMPYVQQADEANRLIKEGQAAMWGEFSTAWSYWSLSERNLGRVSYPADRLESRTTLLDLESLMMSSGTAHPDASWRWLNFLTHQYLDFGDTAIPARISVAERSGYWYALDEELAAIYRFALAHSFFDEGLYQVKGPLVQALRDILEGNADLETALAEAQFLIPFTSRVQSQTTPVPTFTPSPPTIQPQADTVIVFTPANDSKLAAYRRLADSFHEAFPNVVVEVRSRGTDPPLPTALSEKADCFVTAPDPLAFVEERAAVLSLEALVDADPELDLADFYFADSFRHAGQLWALPAEGFPKVIVYNKALFDVAEVAYPTLDWTLDDFVDTAIALTQQEGEPYAFVSAVFEAGDLMFFLEQQGASLLDRHEDSVDFLFNTPDTQAAMSWYTDLSQTYKVKPVSKADWGARTGKVIEEWDDLIRQGRAAMWSDYPGGGFVSSGGPFEDEIAVGYAPLPQGPGRVGDYQVLGYYISAQTEHSQICWEWLKFLSERVEQIEGVPARRSLAVSEAYRHQIGPEKALALPQALARAERLTVLQDSTRPGWTSKPLQWLAQAFDAIVGEEELDIVMALDKAQHKADAYRDCLALKDGFDDSAAWEACAREVEESLGP